MTDVKDALDMGVETFLDEVGFGGKAALFSVAEEATSAELASPSVRRQEKPTLAQALAEVVEDCAFGQPGITEAAKKHSCSMNDLYAGHTKDLHDLGGLICQCARVTGPAGGGGLYNPKSELASRVKAGDFDELSIDDYDHLVDAVNDVGQLWERESNAQAFPLACNALIREVLEDREVFGEMIGRAFARVDKCRIAIEEGYVEARGGR